MKVRSKEGIMEGEKSDNGRRISIVLKRQLNLADTGMLVIDIENLIPRLRTEGVRGIGVRLAPVR
jgi:hypothetical protein